MGTVHFIRHGDTAASQDGILCGDLDLPLIDSGIAQAEGLARHLSRWKIAAVYASPKLRVRMTAEPTCRALGLTPRYEEGLREIAYGAWEGRHETEVKEADAKAFAAWRADPGTNAPPGGESGFTIAARAVPVVARILEAHPDGEVLVFSHKATIRVMCCALLGIPVGKFRERVGCATASITSFEIGAGGAQLVRLGETA